MIPSIALVSLIVPIVWAQSPFIPTGISSSCTTFLTNLNNDAGLAGCIAPLVAATSKYGPTASHKTPPTVAGVSSDLDNLCAPSTTTACPQPLIRSNLGDFLAACTPELTSNPNDDVIRTYDVLYALVPLQQAVCSKDDSGKYCATETTPPGSGSANVGARDLTPAEISEYLASPATALSKRATGDQVAFIPNATTIANTNLLFLFLNGAMPSAKLCTTCTKNVLTAYINFESAIPYGPGLSQSVLLGGQIQLWSDVSQTCGTNFLGGAVEAAGGLGTNSPFGGSKSGGVRSAGHVGASAVVAAGLSAVGFALAL